jgi:hypothetical protein
VKTTAESRVNAREIATAMVDGTLAPSSRIAGGTILSLLDDLDELLHANARLAPKAKAHDAMLMRDAAHAKQQAHRAPAQVEDGDGDAS